MQPFDRLALAADGVGEFQRNALAPCELARVDDGRVFTGRQGIPLKLADSIGGEREAIEWLQKEKGVAKDLPVRDWKPEAGIAGFRLTSLAADAAAAAGWPSIAGALRSHEFEADGLMSIWRFSPGADAQ